MCVVCNFLELISSLVLALRPHRVANNNDCICSGVWSPELKHKSLDLEQISRRTEHKQKPSDLPPVWTPNSSPTPDRKSYKPVRFESPTLSRKKINADDKKVLTFYVRSTDRLIDLRHFFSKIIFYFTLGTSKATRRLARVEPTSASTSSFVANKKTR